MGLEWYTELAGEWSYPIPPPDPEHPEKKPKLPHWLPIILDREEVQQLVGAPEAADERLVLRTLYASGMRVEELVALGPESLQLELQALRLLGDRLVVVDGQTFQELARATWSAWPRTVEQVGELVVGAGERSGVLGRYQAVGRKLLPKALRHAYGCHCLENGMDLYSLFRLMGHKYVDTTQALLQVAVGRYRQGYLACHPLCNPSPLGGHEQCNLSVEEMRMLLEAARQADNPRTGFRNGLIARLLYASGVRVGELAHACFADVGYSEGRIFVRQGKGQKDRYALLDPKTVELLREWQGEKALAEPLFDLQDRQIRNIVEDAGERTGLLTKYQAMGYSLSPHSFRHAYATHLYRNGMDSYAIEHLLGHADLETTFKDYVACDLGHWEKAYSRAHELGQLHGR